MKASLLFTFLLCFIFSNANKISDHIDSYFLSPSKLISSQIRIDYFLDAKSDFDEISKQFLTELLEDSIQVISYLLQEVPTTLSPSASSRPLCSEFGQLTISQMSPSDVILLIANDKNSKNPLSLEDCSSSLNYQKLGLIKISMPLLLTENETSIIYSLIQSLSKIYFENAKVLEKLDELFNANLGTPCTSACKVCDTNAGACVTCYDSTHMSIKNGICYCTDPNALFFSPTNSCVCKSGYFLNSTNFCALCPTICASCTSSSSCLSCINPTQMTLYDNWCYCSNPEGSIFNSTSKFCNCPDGTWIDGEICQTCNATCSTCSNQNTCTSCIDPENMSLTEGICKCKDPHAFLNVALELCECQAWYYMENSTCYHCQQPCETCSSDTFCNSCLDWRMDLSNGICTCPSNSTFSVYEGRCICDIGYFLNSFQDCEPCSSGCATCRNSQSCLSCMDPDAMILENGVCSCRFPGSHFNSTTMECDCPFGMFRNGSDCISCSEGCLYCTNETNCVSCSQPDATNYPYSLIDGVCECTYPHSIPDGFNGCYCVAGYYLSPDKLECLECPDVCLVCSSWNGYCKPNQSVCCLSCANSLMSINDDGLCQCIPPNSHFSNQTESCQCDDGYYMNNQSCSLCSLPCGNCISATDCDSCVLPDQMTLINSTCICTSPNNSTYDLQLNQCVCPVGTYLNSTGCDNCPETCISCDNSAKCLSCKDPVHMIIDSNGICACPENSTYDGETCVCDNDFFWRGLECTDCESPCKQCVNQTVCLSCLDSMNMVLSNGTCKCRDPNAIFNDLENSCVCNSGYFMINSVCRACQISCSTCENNLACTSCVDKNNMSLVNGLCTCSDMNASFILSQKKCVCNQGYQLADNVCIECPMECSSCSFSNVCTQCANPEEMEIISGTCVCNGSNTAYDPIANSCVCKEQYYYDGNECVACQSPLCGTCENNKCLSCIDSVNMTLSCGTCLCSDPNSFFNVSSGLCECLSNSVSNLIGNALQCIPVAGPCKEFSIEGLCLKCPSNMLLFQGQCYCQDPNASYNIKTQNCTCNLSHLQHSNSKFCQPCDSYIYGGIMGCTKCKNGKCLGCQKNMLLSSSGDSCTCKPGFVWDNILGTCICAPGFWNSTECPPCGCYSCTANGTCLEPCSQNSTWNNGVCSCDSDFYKCGDNLCCSMNTTCASWNDKNCYSCVGVMQLVGQNTDNAECLCWWGLVYSPQNNNCVCPQEGNYYYNGWCYCRPHCNCESYDVCKSCQAPFLLQNNNCACDPNAVQSWNNCICQDGYYMNSTYSCLPCPENCATCISSTTCTSCNNNLLLINNTCFCSDFNAVYNIETNQCECTIGYYNEYSKCVSCLATCYDCLEDGVTCTSCADEMNMIFNEGVCSCIDPNAVFNINTLKCECLYGYYNNVCSACAPSCSQCSYNQCLSCYDSAHMALVGNSCICLDPNSYFVEWAKVCACKSGFYFSGQICVPFPGQNLSK